MYRNENIINIYGTKPYLTPVLSRHLFRLVNNKKIKHIYMLLSYVITYPLYYKKAFAF